MSENLIIALIGIVGSIATSLIIMVISNSKNRAEFANKLENAQIKQQSDIEVLKELKPLLTNLNTTLNNINTQVAIHEVEIKALQKIIN